MKTVRETGTPLNLSVKQAGAEAFCRVLGIKPADLLNDLAVETVPPRYPEAETLWGCDTLETLRATVSATAGSTPTSFVGKAQAAYLDAVETAIRAGDRPAPVQAITQRAVRQGTRQLATVAAR